MSEDTESRWDKRGGVLINIISYSLIFKWRLTHTSKDEDEDEVVEHGGNFLRCGGAV